MPLHTDLRPKSFKEIEGNSETVEALQIHVNKPKPNRSLLIIGESGCGKTTLASVVAHELGAMKNSIWNFRLLNASDFRGIDMVRDLIEQSQRKPLMGSGARVFVLDECHKLTNDAQEAILKLLEDPPAQSWFILCTTNPEKLKVTLKRRCTEFQVSPLPERTMKVFLGKILRSEQKKVPQDVIQQIINESMGSPGIALNILDKIIDLPSDKMAETAKIWAAKSSNVITLCRAILKENQKSKPKWKDLLPIIKELEDQDPETLRRQILEYFRKVLISGDESAYAIMIEFSSPYYDTGKSGLIMSIYQAFTIE